MAVTIIQSICTNSNCYKAGQKITVKGLVIHSVGCNQPNAKVFVNQWNNNTTDVCVHAVIDPTGIYQTLPWNHRGWHAGTPCNNTYIGVETTEPASITYKGGATFVDNNPTETKKHIAAVYKKSVDLFAMLCKQYNLNPLGKNVILSHNEAGKLGIATKHVDPDHLWGKYGYTMDKFRKDVKSALDALTTPKQIYRIRKTWADASSQIGAYTNLDSAKKQCKAGYSVFDSNGKAVYTVKATTTTKVSYTQGSKVTLKNTNVYTSSTATKASGIKTGTFYLYDGKNTKGRYRITTSKANCGKTPPANYVTGWINKTDIK